MTRDATRPLDAGPGPHHIHHDVETDLLAGLWETAPFARLPWDAPPELKELVEDIQNPRRVYAIHQASRRHGFQQLVEKFIVQLRDGCGSNYCSTPTCFSFRKRSVGRIPIRRYNVTSARVLAVYMAGQDNPENALCPALRSPKMPPAALDSLIFYRKPSLQHTEERTRPPGKGRTTADKEGQSKSRQVRVKAKVQVHSSSRESSAGKERNTPASPQETPAAYDGPKFEVTERHTGKDYRSFAANMFGTVAFKMLEWLTPNALDDMHETACDLEKDNREEDFRTPKPRRRKSSPRPESPRQDSPPASPKEHDANDFSIAEEATAEVKPLNGKAEIEQREKENEPLVNGNGPVSTRRPGSVRRNSNARVRTNSATKPKRKLSLDTYPPDLVSDEPVNGLKSPRLPGFQAEKNSRSCKTTTSTFSRPPPQAASADYLARTRIEESSPAPPQDRNKPDTTQIDEGLGQRGAAAQESDHQSTPSEISASDYSMAPPDGDTEVTYDSFLPQAISRLNVDVVDFVCDVLQDDGTREQHLLEPAEVPKSLAATTTKRVSKLKRRHKSRRCSYPADLKKEWKLFIEQSLFYTLSDPHALIHSFTHKGELIDSQALWYCMLRMTRVAPTLVYHCLWLSAAHLFAPPKSVQSLRSPTARLFPKQEVSLSNAEAGRLMSICLHALIAAAPMVSEKSQLTEMSRLRSQGLSLAASGSQPAELCLQYDDAFSHDLAMRLARRLLSAITARRYFDDMLSQETPFGDASEGEPDVLAPLFTQLDALSVSNEEGLHETRMSTLLLDWARAVMFYEWDGSPEVPEDGPFGGALALTDAINKKSQALRITHKQLLADYFSERLDNVDMPVAWLSFTSTRQKGHLLDHPYIFNPDTLVSYFRAINFSRMSHVYEEAASLQNRLDRLFEQATLIVNRHHKTVLQDLLRTARSRYLILDIGRKTVLRDAFDQLWRREERELLRPLKVHLGEDSGEEGFDSGGVQQEFFRLAIAEALNPDYGAFTIDERNRMAWFQPGSTEPDWKFELVGLLVGLAVYNGLTLPVSFPKALYRKLLGEPVTDIHHINDGWPQIASSLTELLEWDESNGAVEDIFAVTYEFSANMLNEHVSREMHSLTPGSQTPSDHEWPQFPPSSNIGNQQRDWTLSCENPEDAPFVTDANRNAYVSDYIRYMTDVSVRPQYEAFAKGFRSILHPKSLTLLSPELLQNLVEGQQEIDVSELRRAARYVGYSSASRTIKDFWKIVREYDDQMKRKLLEFVTASDRVPVGGVKNIQFVVQKNGEEDGHDGHLPTAYTCYGTLLLPEYRDREVLKERLSMALENAQGFGFA
ncbi:hypothetical protein J7T55_014015 [Diaporthe amygdali]|uniref:uncharacterized protein n=1 Tax=Phomopsis amygdali TaxID=1214568 RepID=UPI0022FF01FB|nr:uncharacterized protein J7T55_014015 [Diaporthe amygdali]KAJ0119810.1 hypothetical protein J7T55_014015 [Diaporthe amygdali]